MTNIYETGLRALLEQLGRDHQHYTDALVYQQRLVENLAEKRRYGDTETRRAGRAEIIAQLNTLAQETLGTTFNDLCSEEKMVDISPSEHRPSETTQTHSLYGSKFIKITISQMFRMADLLTRPDSVKAQEFYDAVTNSSKMRRVLNKRSVFDLETLGKLRPVVATSEKYDRFWTAAIPDLRQIYEGDGPLCFIPYEVILSEHLRNRHVSIKSIDELQHQIQNIQSSSRLRIYPPGTGVVRLEIALEFKESINIDAVSKLAMEMEDLFFVDPHGQEKPYEEFFLNVINEIAKALFVEDGYSHEQRCWRPPTTAYSLRGETSLNPREEMQSLARLISLTPGNWEPMESVENHIHAAIGSSQWQNEGLLAVAAEGTALFIVSQTATGRTRKKKLELLRWLSETHELVTSAIHAQRAFVEKSDNLYFTQGLDASWLPDAGDGKKFAYLDSLLRTMLKVMQAIGRIRSHLHKQGGSMMHFAKSLWFYSNPIEREQFIKSLDYIGDWLQEAQAVSTDRSIVELRKIVARVKQIPAPFS
ncbi:MAG: hypothetical protein K8R89_04580 [Anaerolineae bacterium]|nr:hypothetical protein [Anaerolineae bacterium]